MKHSWYTQASAVNLSGVLWKNPYSEYSETEISLINSEIEKAYKVAIEEAIFMIRAIP